MDEETEKRLAKLIMEEAAMLRKRADREGVHVYLAKPTVRVRPNPQFLRATIRSVEQSNRIVEVNEMWRRRAAELDLDKKSGRSRRRENGGSSSLRRCDGDHKSRGDHDRRSVDDDPEGVDAPASCSADLGDDEVEQFLNTRAKRGRGSIGSRMDEPGPYLAAPLTSEGVRSKEDWEDRLVGPQLPDKGEWKKQKLEQYDDGDGASDDAVGSKRTKKDQKTKTKQMKKKKKKRKRD